MPQYFFSYVGANRNTLHLTNISMVFCSRAQPLLEVTHERNEGGINHPTSTCVRRRPRDFATGVPHPRDLSLLWRSGGGLLICAGLPFQRQLLQSGNPWMLFLCFVLQCASRFGGEGLMSRIAASF